MVHPMKWSSCGGPQPARADLLNLAMSVFTLTENTKVLVETNGWKEKKPEPRQCADLLHTYSTILPSSLSSNPSLFTSV